MSWVKGSWKEGEPLQRLCNYSQWLVYREVRDSSDLLGPVNVLHACDECVSTLGCASAAKHCSCSPISAEFLKCLKMNKTT